MYVFATNLTFVAPNSYFKRHLEKESDGGESILFREKFSDWGDFARPVSYAGSSSSALKYTHTLSLQTLNFFSIRVAPKPQPTMTRVRMLSTLEKRKEEKERIDIDKLHSETRYLQKKTLLF